MLTIAAAGNDEEFATLTNPGSCTGVLSVGAVDRNWRKSRHSNFGRQVRIHASANPVDALDAVRTTGAAVRDGGTSFAAPIVSGIAAVVS